MKLFQGGETILNSMNPIDLESCCTNLMSAEHLHVRQCVEVLTLRQVETPLCRPYVDLWYTIRL